MRLVLSHKVIVGRRVHVGGHWTWVDGVDRGTFGQLAGPGSCHGLESGLGAAVDGLRLVSERGRDGGQIHDATGAIVGKVGESSLHEEQGSTNIDVVLSRKLLAVDVFYQVVAGHACVVDDDANLELAGFWVLEVVFGYLDNVLGTILGAHVGLHDDGLDAMFGLEFGGELFGDFGGRIRGVVEDEVAALAGQVSCDGSTNTWRDGSGE